MLDSNGMSSYQSQPVVQQSSSLNLHDEDQKLESGFDKLHRPWTKTGDPYSADHMYSWREWVWSDDFERQFPGLSAESKNDIARNSGLDRMIYGLFGPGAAYGDAYKTMQENYSNKHDLLNQYEQFSKLGISPYMLIDNTSVSASGSSNLRSKEQKDNGSGRLLGILLLALARIAAAIK